MISDNNYSGSTSDENRSNSTSNDVTLDEDDWKIILHKFDQKVASFCHDDSWRFPRNKLGSHRVKFKFPNIRMKSNTRARSEFIHNMICEGSPHAAAKHWKFRS